MMWLNMVKDAGGQTSSLGSCCATPCSEGSEGTSCATATRGGMGCGEGRSERRSPLATLEGVFWRKLHWGEGVKVVKVHRGVGDLFCRFLAVRRVRTGCEGVNLCI